MANNLTSTNPQRQVFQVVVSAFLLALLMLGLFLFMRSWWGASPVLDPEAKPRPVTARGDLALDEKTIIDIFEKSSDSVVHITRLTARRNLYGLDLSQIPEGSGSGFVWDKKGYIVTNYHVVEGTNQLLVTFADQSTWKGTVIGTYPDKDLAVLRIDAPASKLFPIPVGTSSDLRVGQKALAIGNPFGLDQTLTVGVVSAVGREIEAVTGRTIENVIQTDAAINPGNSGGPLLDSAGRLIGVNTAIVSPSGAFAGIGFAIPVDEVNRAVPELIRKGKITRVGLGIQVAPDQIAAKLNLPGVLILRVQPGTPAEKAGLRGTNRDAGDRIILGDVITAIDGKQTKNVNDLLDVLDTYKVGDTVTVTTRRNGKEVQFEIALEALK